MLQIPSINPESNPEINPESPVQPSRREIAAAQEVEKRRRLTYLAIPATIGLGLLMALVYLGVRVVAARRGDGSAVSNAVAVIPAVANSAAPSPGGSSPTVVSQPRMDDAKLKELAEEQRRAAEKLKADEKLTAAEKLKAQEKLKAEEKIKAEQKRKAEEQAKADAEKALKAEQKRQAEEKLKADEKTKADAKAKVEAALKAEQKLKAEKLKADDQAKAAAKLAADQKTKSEKSKAETTARVEPAANRAPEVPATKKVRYADGPLTLITPERGQLFLQLAALSPKTVLKYLDELHGYGLEPSVAPGPDGSILVRVLVGPFPNTDSFNRAKEHLNTSKLVWIVRAY